MATEARIGHGTTLGIAAVDTPEGPYTLLGEITSVTPPPIQRDIIDATHMDSPEGWREFIAGLKDGGEMSVDLNFVPGSATDDLLVAMQAEDDKRPMQITFPNGAVWEFEAFCTGYEPSAPVDDKMTATATFKVSGKPDFIEPS